MGCNKNASGACRSACDNHAQATLFTKTYVDYSGDEG